MISAPAVRRDPAAPVPEEAHDGAAIAALVERVFGPGRLAKTAERLREGNVPIPDLCFVVRVGDQLAGTVRMWPIEVGGRRAAFLGPIAVDPDHRLAGVGAALVEAAASQALAQGLPVLLVGDLSYFRRFGFEPAPEARLPGPVNPARVLARVMGEPLQGEVRIAPR